MSVTYSKLRLRRPAKEEDEEEKPPVDIARFSYDEECDKLMKERVDLEAEIKRIKQELKKEKDNFAEQYDKLTKEQQEIMDTKCQETKDVNEELARVTEELKEAKNMLLAKSQIDTKLKALTEQAETVANQEKLFIEEISRYTRALVELGTSSATTGNELLLSVTRLPKFRGPEQKEAAKLAQSMYALRMVLVKRYAESVGSGCDVQ